MSTPFYDLASLVVVPSGYKSGKVYAQKPLTTDGQLAFTRASTATRVNASGLIETVASGVPRLDYLGSSCPKILLEPQRSNTQVKSEDFANWLGINNVTLTANTTDTASPTGANTATKVVIGSGAPLRIFEFTGSSAGTGTISLFVKAGTSTSISLFTSSASLNVSYNLATQVVSPNTGTGTITNYGNGWYRITATATLGSNEVLQILFTGSVGQTIYIWGAQCEAAAYATSYIPTLGASVTRVADAASKTGISSLIGQTEGTIYWEGSGNATVGGSDLWMASISVDDTNVAVLLYYFPGPGTVNVFINNGTTSVSLSAPMTLTQNNKVAVAYKNASFALYLNGALVASSSSAIAPPTAMNQFAFVKWVGGTNQERELVKQALLFKTRLTNAQLAELTSL
jgi:hypothetical protein